MRAWEVGFVWNLKPASSQHVFCSSEVTKPSTWKTPFLRLARVSQPANSGRLSRTPLVLWVVSGTTRVLSGCFWTTHLWCEFICRDRELGGRSPACRMQKGEGVQNRRWVGGGKREYKRIGLLGSCWEPAVDRCKEKQGGRRGREGALPEA